MKTVEAILNHDVAIHQTFSARDMMVRKGGKVNDLVIIDFAFADIYLKKCDAYIEEKDTKGVVQGNRVKFREASLWSFKAGLYED
jgi:hypothetical protein